jgi:hypothetical protein
MNHLSKGHTLVYLNLQKKFGGCYLQISVNGTDVSFKKIKLICPSCFRRAQRKENFDTHRRTVELFVYSVQRYFRSPRKLIV